MVDGQPPRPAGAVTGWLQGSFIVSWQTALQEMALGFGREMHHKACGRLLRLPCHPPQPLPPIRLPEPEERPGGVRPLADRLVHSDIPAT
jgi:hypothetical protein